MGADLAEVQPPFSFRFSLCFVFASQVRRFHLKQQKRREVLEQRDQERLAHLRRVMEEEARRDKER